MKILVVDDFATMRRILKHLLAEIGLDNVVEAEDAPSALAKVRSGSFDLVITDWNMPGMSGLELLKAIRTEADTARLPVLMVTAEAKRNQIVEAAEAGVNGYIVKPFTSQTLKDKLTKVFARIHSAA